MGKLKFFYCLIKSLCADIEAKQKMASRFPTSHNQRPPPPYPSGSGRGARGGMQSYARGRGGSFSSGGGGSASAHPVVSGGTPPTSSASAPSAPTSASASNSAPPMVQTQTPNPTPTTASQTPQSAAQQTQVNESKILSNPNPVCLCKIGQGTIQDIVSMTQDLFMYLKGIVPANTITAASPAHPGSGVLPIAMAQEKSAKAEEHLKEISLLFKKLKVIYKNLQPIPNVNDDQGGLLLDIDMTEELIPMKRKRDCDDKDLDVDEAIHKKKFESQAYMQAARELAEVKEKLRSKNQELKSIIDETRTTIWEINSMLGMRKLPS